MADSNNTLMEWLRVQMLRLRSLDCGSGSKSIHWLKDGVAKFSSHYSVARLCSQMDVSPDEVLAFIDSAPALREMEGKSFTASWTGTRLTLSWLEEGIREWNTEISQHFAEEHGAYFVTRRFLQKMIYLDGSERIVSDFGPAGPAEISKDRFFAEKAKMDNLSSS